MTPVSATLQQNFENVLWGNEFDWNICAVRYCIGNSQVHFINNKIGRKIFIQQNEQVDNNILWSVCMDGFVLGKDGTYHYEPTPSSRTGTYLKNTRFDTKDKALEELVKYECKNKNKDIPLFIN